MPLPVLPELDGDDGGQDQHDRPEYDPEHCDPEQGLCGKEPVEGVPEVQAAILQVLPYLQIHDEARRRSLERLDGHLHGVHACAGVIDEIVAGPHVNQGLPVEGDGVQPVVGCYEFTQVRHQVHNLARTCVLVDLERSVPCGRQEHVLSECQPEGEVVDLVLRVVGEVEIVGESLVVVVCQTLVAEVEDLGPCAVPHAGLHGDILLPRAFRGEELLPLIGGIMDLSVVCCGLDETRDE